MSSNNVNLFLNRPINILTAFGVWLPPKNHVILHKIYMLIIMMTQYNFVLFEFIYIANVWGDLDEVSEASYLLFTQASVCYKSTAFLINKNNLIELLNFMGNKLFEPQSIIHERFLYMQSRTIKRLCLFFLTSATTTCTLWACIPLFDNVGKRFFPFKIWMPVGPEKSPQFELGYVYQMVSIYISAFLFIGIDSVSLSMIMFGCAELDIIVDKLKKVNEIASTDNDQNQNPI
ncbi:uncharacterized protein LOC113234993 [Hyposmocoma kahamanoa]|uniref:uncharacterized protein LOC113234993 n=1 Tax=Hyposmocoma kahamanoa TaxID=1477025 RepID=UPI000E6D69CA|nr:uncharacterized protein LOC113234993 [Hyposmocoma kahamanoa]